RTCCARWLQWSSDPSSDTQIRAAMGAATHRAIRAAPRRQGQPADGRRVCINELEAPRPFDEGAWPDSVLVVEANFIHQLAGLFAMFCDLGQRQRIDHEGAEAGDDGIKGYACAH